MSRLDTDRLHSKLPGVRRAAKGKPRRLVVPSPTAAAPLITSLGLWASNEMRDEQKIRVIGHAGIIEIQSIMAASCSPQCSAA